MIGAVNSCGRFTPLRFVQTGERGKPSWGCYAFAKQKSDGTDLKGVEVTFEMAQKEGWVGKNGSKWQTMPELMLQYRAATWWTRMFAPELLMGFPTADEATDIEPTPVAPVAEPVTKEEPPPPARTKTKGVAGMKRAEPAKPETPPPAEKPPTESEVRREERGVDMTPSVAEEAKQMGFSSEAAATLEQAATPAAPTPAATPTKPLRCELETVQEKMVTKSGGVVGPVCTVYLKGEFIGSAYYNGKMDELPDNGAILDVVLLDRTLKGKNGQDPRILQSGGMNTLHASTAWAAGSITSSSTAATSRASF